LETLFIFKAPSVSTAIKFSGTSAGRPTSPSSELKSSSSSYDFDLVVLTACSSKVSNLAPLLVGITSNGITLRTMFYKIAFLSFFYWIESRFVTIGLFKSALTADDTTSGIFCMFTSWIGIRTPFSTKKDPFPSLVEEALSWIASVVTRILRYFRISCNLRCSIRFIFSRDISIKSSTLVPISVLSSVTIEPSASSNGTYLC
jgi:hypothetical protein